MATRITINVPVPTLSAAEQSELKRAFDADMIRVLKRHRPAGSAITNWGGACGVAKAPKKPRKKKAGEKKAGKKKAAKKKR